MALTTKESVPPSPQAQEDAQAAQSATPQATPRTDPIGIEVPVIVHASRYSAATKGLNKPLPPVHEETRTVIVFAQGAVVRLTASLSLGETVVLTNLQTGADVLCRVASVKAQAGIQNYIDLEFTQRAPGFWSKTSKADATAIPTAIPASVVGPQSLVPEVAPQPEPAPVIPVPAPAPVQASTPLPPPAVESAPPVAQATPQPAPTPTPKPMPPAPPSNATLGVQPEIAARPSPAPRTAVRTSSSVVAGASAGMRQTHGDEQAVLGGGLDWTKESPARSKKGLIAAIAILAVGGVAGGAYLLGQRGHSAQPNSEIAVAAPSAPAQPPQTQPDKTPAAPPADSVPAAAMPAAPAAPAAPAPAANSVSAAPPSAAEKPVEPPRASRREPAQAELARSAAEPPQRVNPAAALRPAVEIGNLKAPVLRNAAITGSSEPPPTLSTQEHLAAQDVLRSGALSGAQGVQAPAPPVAFASPVPVRMGGQFEVPEPAKASSQPPMPEPVKAGGQLQMPKAISSPPPTYPDLARTQGIQGAVAMDVLIDAAGNVVDMKVTSGPVVLRQAAMDALRRWKYRPARLNGQPTSVHVNVTINFANH